MPSETAPAARVPVNLFYSYAHEDETLRNELQDHLMILERRKVIRSWHDRAIVAGEDWSSAIDEHLRTADLVLLLISKDFIASDYIMGAELRLAMDRHARRDAVVVPILLRKVDLQPEDEEDLPFVGLLKVQGLPKDLQPVTSWTNRDEAWTNVASGLRLTVKLINERKVAAAAAAIGAGDADRLVHLRGVVPENADRLAPPVLLPVDEVFGPGAPSTAEPAPEHPRFAAVVDEVTASLREATLAKGGTPDRGEIREQAKRLIDLPDSKRVLWVDDHPSNNAAEIAALARLQIEVVTVSSTADAMAHLAATGPDDPYDLVISDWQRGAEGPLAGLRLLTSMRRHDYAQPVVFYHGTFGTVERAALAASARLAGAHGEAVHPNELMRFVLSALHA